MALSACRTWSTLVLSHTQDHQNWETNLSITTEQCVQDCFIYFQRHSFFNWGFHNSYHPIFSSSNLQQKKSHRKLSLEVALVMLFCLIAEKHLPCINPDFLGRIQPVDHSRIQLNVGTNILENSNSTKPWANHWGAITEATGGVKVRQAVQTETMGERE